MRHVHPRRLVPFLGILVLLGVSACTLAGPAVRTPTPVPSPSPSWTPSPTATLRPWPTRRPTATLTPAPLFPLQYEHLPTTLPSPEAAARRARDLVCQPPCWFGLEPGVSTLQDLQDLWGSWSEIFWKWMPEEQIYSGYLTNSAFYIGFDADRLGTLTAMEIQPKRTLPEYAPASFMRRLGPPSWIVRFFAWDEPGGEEPIVDTSGLLIFYFGYPSRYVVIKMLGFTEDLGLELPKRFRACIPNADFSVTYFAYPKTTFTQADVWLLQDNVDPPGHFLTSKEQILQQILEEKAPFCVDIERSE